MKTIFIDTLIELAAHDERIYLVTGDLGYPFIWEFQQKFPDRFFNIGVAEQNMIGIAAGLALSEKIVFAYSIIPFLTMRPFEQIRNDICHQNLSVRLIGVGGGLAYGTAGATHFAVEDIAIMRSLVNMTVIAPGDASEAGAAIRASAKCNGPVYIRLGKADKAPPRPLRRFKIGVGRILQDGDDITIITTGSMLHTGRHVSKMLADQNISARLISMPTVKPLDEKLVLESAKRTKAIFTIEEHSLIGGLGSAVCETLAESKHRVLVKRFALPDKYGKFIGDQQYLLAQRGLLPTQIAERINSIIGDI